MAEQLTFQFEDGGSIPTSPLQLILKRISKHEALECMKKWHYLGDKNFIASYNFGVFYTNILYGCISFGPPSAWETVYGIFKNKDQHDIFEIKRLALSNELPKNSESRVIAIAIKLLKRITKIKAIITYADSRVGHTGIIYRASGFKYLGLTVPKKDFWVDGKIQERGKTHGVAGEWKSRSRKHKFIKIFGNYAHEAEFKL